jgi:hypothetical protein
MWKGRKRSDVWRNDHKEQIVERFEKDELET